MSSTALERFVGEDGERRLIDAFATQAITYGDRDLATKLARAAHVEVHSAGAEIICQGGDDTDFFLILLGTVDVERNGRGGRVRSAGDHFGEMSTIDVHARRSATVRARGDTVVARIPEAGFAAIAQEHPGLWRCLAVEISRRLRQRLEDLPPRNDRPHVFVGSSREGLPIAEAIEAGVKSDDVVVQIWSEGVFEASATNIEALEGAVRSADVAVLVLSPDDKARSRGRTKASPRDNVIFELGLFTGALGRRRAFVVRPTSDIKMPSDLLGMTPIYYEPVEGGDLNSVVSAACAELTVAIERLGPR